KKAFDKNFSFENIKDQKILDLFNGQVYKFLYYYKYATNSIFSVFYMSNFEYILDMIFELERNPATIKTKKRRKELFGDSILYSPY
ncbi:MAG: hypothetical protein ACP5R3_02585, partial [Thermoplasmata archaeon]